jgi:hypothetical protein
MKKVLATLLFLTAFSITAFADIARPDGTPKAKTSKSIDTYLNIRLEKDAKEAKLIIPKNQIKELRAQLDAIENDDDTTAATAGSDNRISTIVSGAFLSAAFIFAGIWFVRSGRLNTKGGKAAAVGVVLLASGAFATMVYANAGPPSDARSITGRMFTRGMHYYKFGGGKIKLEVSDTETTPKLIVPDDGGLPTGEE